MRIKKGYLGTLILLALLLVGGCISKTPSDIDNLCTIFKEKRSWYKAAKKVEQRRGSPIAVMMAFIYQESSFIADARPGRVTILGIPMWWRKSSSYGYSQAKVKTWDWYREKTSKQSARRDRFADALDFIGWYNGKSRQLSKIRSDNAYALYLAYHEGHGGYNKKSYQSNKPLLEVASKVERLAANYRRQLQRCRL